MLEPDWCCQRMPHLGWFDHRHIPDELLPDLKHVRALSVPLRVLRGVRSRIPFRTHRCPRAEMVDSDCRDHVPYRCKSHSIWPDGDVDVSARVRRVGSDPHWTSATECPDRRTGNRQLWVDDHKMSTYG